MRLVSYREEGGWRAGVLVEERVVNARAAAERAGLEADAMSWESVRSIIAKEQEELDGLADAAAAVAADLGIPLAEVHLGPPVPDPGKILCIGLNYLDHQQESAAGGVSAAQELPRFPLVFNKFSTSLIGDGEEIVPPAATSQLDFESELAVVIGKTARDVTLENAMDHVAGYSVMNDVSARDLQLRSPQWAIGKGFDKSAPFGPALVLVDEIPDPQNLAIEGRLNGEVMQSSNTSMMIFPVAQLIEYIAQALTLEPGDVIATGTPAGVGFARKPPVYLTAGDVFEVSVEGVGTISNPVAAPSSSFVSRLEDPVGSSA